MNNEPHPERGYLFDPEIGRILNADAYTSTGQGQLGNNIFTYCNNNPESRIDRSGTASCHVQVAIFDRSGNYAEPPFIPQYITDQTASNVGSKSFGVSTVSDSGCGAVATYNAMIMLDDYVSFDSVLDYYNYNDRALELTVFGAAGVLPNVVAGYFENMGYDVRVTDSLVGMDAYSQSADACIMFYMFPRSYQVGPVSLDLFGAHFIAYNRVEGGYVGNNTGASKGISSFAFPSEFGYSNGRFYVIGVFIYNRREK